MYWFGMYAYRTAHTAVCVSFSIFVLLSLYCLYSEHSNERMLLLLLYCCSSELHPVHTLLHSEQLDSLQGSCCTLLFLAAHVRIHGFDINYTCCRKNSPSSEPLLLPSVSLIMVYSRLPYRCSHLCFQQALGPRMLVGFGKQT